MQKVCCHCLRGHPKEQPTSSAQLTASITDTHSPVSQLQDSSCTSGSLECDISPQHVGAVPMSCMTSQTDFGIQGGLAAQAQPKPADLEKGLRARKVAYYSKCELLVYQPHKSAEDYLKGKNRFRKRKAANSSDEETDKKDAASVFLQIQYAFLAANTYWFCCIQYLKFEHTHAQFCDLLGPLYDQTLQCNSI